MSSWPIWMTDAWHARCSEVDGASPDATRELPGLQVFIGAPGT
jgi:hypothetical protein